MATTLEQLNLWINSQSENQCLEFKEAKNHFEQERLFKYCVALSNEGGGQLILGVTDKHPRKVVGTSVFLDLPKVTEQLFNKLGFRIDIEELTHPDGRVLVFHIPSRNQGTARQLEGAYYMRSGESLVAMSEDQLKKIFLEGSPDWLEEESLGGLDEQRVIDLLDTQGFFELLKLPYPTTRTGVLDKLKQERLIDEKTGSFSIRRIGGILLAKNLNNFPDLSRKAARVIVYNGLSKLDTKSDITGTYGYAVGFQRLVKYIMSQLPQNEVIQNALRQEVKLVPEIAVRELVANALIHQDLTMSGTSVMFEVYSNRVEFSNPGIPIIKIERFIDGYQSRNERLADLMRRLFICEEKGSGIDKVIDAAEMYQLPAPEFLILNHRSVATIFGPKPFEEMDRADRVRACYQHAALRWVMSERMTNQSLRERFKLPESRAQTISQVISQTMEEDLILLDEKVGTSRKYARYIPFWAA
jgi:predicted HTH transcriptional regulator